jgi:ribulose-phosphate 3-epimerase
MREWRPQIAASILTADFGHLDRVVRKLEKAGVDRLHLDVMDGHFVPNITFGPTVVAGIRRLTDLPLDVHLMISDPAAYVPRFLEARPETVTFHIEAGGAPRSSPRRWASSATRARRPASPSAPRPRSTRSDRTWPHST